MRNGYATDDSEWWGAKWGAILFLRQATLSLLKRSIYLCELASSHGQQQPATARPSFASRGSGVQIPSAPPSAPPLSSTHVVSQDIGITPNPCSRQALALEIEGLPGTARRV